MAASAPGGGHLTVRAMTTPPNPRPTEPSGRPGPWWGRPAPRWAWYVVAAAALVGLFAGPLLSPPGPRPVSFSQIEYDITHHRAVKASLDNNSWSVTLTLKGGQRVTSGFPQYYSSTLTAQLLRADVPTSAVPLSTAPWWRPLVQTLATMVVLLGGGYLLISKQGAGFKRLSEGRGEVADVPATRFTDVAGADEAVAELAELVDFLRVPERFEATGARIPRGILLVGPPGTGKTLMARAVAGEAGVAFYALSGSDFIETFVGVGASRVRNVFAKARKKGRAIIFIDEIDAVGKARVNGGNGATEERENTLNQLLVEMDGFSASGVIVLAATNRPDVLDSALTRAGRFDRRIPVTLPDRAGRAKILALVAARRPLDPGVDLEALARRTSGLSGADLDYLMNEAALEAARHERSRIAQADLDAAVETVHMGRARLSAVVTDRDREITAWHEAGHTVAALISPHVPDPVSVTIIPRGPAGGVTWMDGTDDQFMTRTRAHEQLAVLLAGRCAERILLAGDFTQGAASDLAVATRLATEMVTRYGMTDAGLAVLDVERSGPGVQRELLEAVNELLTAAQTRATAILDEHRDLLGTVAAALLDRETITSAELAQLAPRAPSSDVVTP